jgi:hypothetical protein
MPRQMKGARTMYKLKTDIIGRDGLTTTYDGTQRFETIEEAREAAQAVRNGLYEDYSNYEIKDFTVDIIPVID